MSYAKKSSFFKTKISENFILCDIFIRFYESPSQFQSVHAMAICFDAGLSYYLFKSSDHFITSH